MIAEKTDRATRQEEAAQSGRTRPRAIVQREEIVVRFCGDSGDGMQLAGSRMTDTSAISRVPWFSILVWRNSIFLIMSPRPLVSMDPLIAKGLSYWPLGIFFSKPIAIKKSALNH